MITLKNKIVGLKIDVDTERGTRIGVQNLLQLFAERNIKATFLFSMGPDNTGRAIRRIFRPGFFQKVSRTSVLKVYGFKTLFNGLFGNGPHIGKRHGAIMRSASQKGHEVGVHCYDHNAWQDKLSTWSEARVREEVNRSISTFTSIFGRKPHTMGAAGWQANKESLCAYEDCSLTYASDVRGTKAFYPTVKRRRFNTLQIPTTLPTLDELIGRPEYPIDTLINVYHEKIKSQSLNVLTIHAELEGMHFLEWFTSFLDESIAQGISFCSVETIANDIKQSKQVIPHLPLIQGTVDGRSGTLAMHGS
ncbi:MAG: polysaccharide deacetylase family protein [Candidatus Paracaedibacteraceae bacterium]|nr:polysaccharide deacetylase family protein [Candidatus Paracaedibacteraceae bacterium]